MTTVTEHIDPENPRAARDELDATAISHAEIARHVIRRQMNQSGNILLSAVEPMDDDVFFEAGVNGISVAWPLGHLACVMDLFCGWIDGKGRLHDERLHAMFNPLGLESDPRPKAERVDRKSATRAKLILAFRSSQVRALHLLESFDLSLWNQATDPNVPDSLPLWGSIWEALGVHTFWHLGELAGCMPRFHGTYTLNTVLHYFYVPKEEGDDEEGCS